MRINGVGGRIGGCFLGISSSSENNFVKVERVRGRRKFGKEVNNIVLKFHIRGPNKTAQIHIMII